MLSYSVCMIWWLQYRALQVTCHRVLENHNQLAELAYLISGVSRVYKLVGPQRGPCIRCTSVVAAIATSKLGESGGMPPEKVFEK